MGDFLRPFEIFLPANFLTKNNNPPDTTSGRKPPKHNKYIVLLLCLLCCPIVQKQVESFLV